MKHVVSIIAALSILLSAQSWAGGTPDQVKFPTDYVKKFSLYETRNRANGQYAEIYANPIAIASAKSGTLANGSVLVMELYKPKMDAADKPITGSDGKWVKDSMIARLVMEKNNWGDKVPATERNENWAYAMYGPDGKAKANEAPCAGCHIPLKSTDYLNTLSNLQAVIQ